MANPFVKGWKYLMALFGAKIDEYADPKVQIQQRKPRPHQLRSLWLPAHRNKAIKNLFR